MVIFGLLVSADSVKAAPPVVSNVRAAQRAGTELVDVTTLVDAWAPIAPDNVLEAAALSAARGDLDRAGSYLTHYLDHDLKLFRLSDLALAIRLGKLEAVREVSRLGARTPVRLAARSAASVILAEHDGELAVACEGFRDAAERFGSLAMLPDRGRALTGLGRCLLALSETEEGVTRLKEARELWVSMKATPRIAEIDELLATVT